MKAYKATYNQKCINITYKEGKTYTFNGKLELCNSGFHFCKNPIDTLDYYPYNKNFVLMEIEVLGNVISDNKSVTDKFKVIKVLSFNETKELLKDKIELDINNNLMKYEDSTGYWYKQEFDVNNNLIKFEDSTGYWYKQEFDVNNNLIKFEDSKKKNYSIVIE